MTAPVDLRLHSTGGFLVITMSGELDISTVEPVKSRLVMIAEKVPGVVFVDLGDVTFLDSTACGLFMQMHRALTARDQVLVLANVRHSVGRPLQILGLDRLIPTTYTDQPARPWSGRAEAQEILQDLDLDVADTPASPG